MSKIFITFGDSWPATSNIEDKTLAFPNIIAKNLGFESINYGQDATSIEHAVTRLLNFFQNEYDSVNEYAILFCLTDPSRSMIWEPNAGQIIDPEETFWAHSCFTREIQINEPRDCSKIYYKHIHSERQDTHNYFKNLILVKSLCDQYNIKVFFANNFEMQKPLNFKLLDGIKIFPKSLREILSVNTYSELGPYKEIRTANENVDKTGHPTIAGNAVLAEHLTNWIRQWIN